MNRYERLARRCVKGLVGMADLRHEMAGPRILIYHQVGSALGREMEVTVDAFAAQMMHLRGLEPLTLDDALDGGSKNPVVTFDDGYRDTYSTAFPILLDQEIPIVLYLATESIETGRALGPLVGAEPLTWDQIGHMHASGLVSIGAHTHTHLDLRNATESQVEDEIARSDELITRNLGVVPQHFAYPWGYWGGSADAVLRTRYRSCVLGGSPSPRFDDPHLLARIPVQSTDSLGGFRAKLRHGGRSEERVRRALKGYRGP